MAKTRTYFCIDMKSFYASVECAERGYNPFETNLVVADLTRGKNALCLAITPAMKAQGIRNRCRLSEIPSNVKYEVAPPRMALYIEYAADIYSLYLDYFDPRDIHVYSIDESFLDVTDYLAPNHMDAVTFAKHLMNEIADRFHIPATAGIGTNLYLAKIALDITAKHAKDHVGVLYKVFGKNAELLIDHAWGREPCLISDIKAYKSKSKSVSFSQILPRDYTFQEARTVMHEMALNGAAELMRRKVITSKVGIFVGYTRDELAPTKGMAKLDVTTALASFLVEAALRVYDKTTDRCTKIRRLGITFEDVCDEGCEGYNLFTNFDAVERERTVQQTVLNIRQRYGKNAVLRGINYMPEGTQRERNGFIGGHRAGYDDKSRKS